MGTITNFGAVPLIGGFPNLKFDPLGGNGVKEQVKIHSRV